MTNKIVEYELKNGLKVYYYPVEGVYSHYASLIVRAGKIFEAPSEYGLAHFTEHAHLLGTKGFPTPSKLSSFAGENGIVYNASTGHETTEYWVRAPFNKVQQSLRLLFEISVKPLLDEREVLKEKSVVLSEHDDLFQNPDRKFSHSCWENRFADKNHPYAHRPLGNPKTIATFNGKKVSSFINRFYSAENMFLLLVGNFGRRSLKGLLESRFGAIGGGERVHEQDYPREIYSNFAVNIQKDPRKQSKFVLTLPSFGKDESSRKERLTLQLVGEMIGGRGQGSRLIKWIREQERLVYDIAAGGSTCGKMGTFEIFGSCSVDNLSKVLKLIREELDKVRTKGFGQSELLRAKGILNSGGYMAFDDIGGIHGHFAGQIIADQKIWSPEEYAEVVLKISLSEVNKMAKRILVYDRLNINILGDFSKAELKGFEKMYQ